MLPDIVLLGYVFARSHAVHLRSRLAHDDRGEGVISAAIAVLIMAFLGAAMWVVFRQLLDDSGQKTNSTINMIGG